MNKTNENPTQAQEAEESAPVQVTPPSDHPGGLDGFVRDAIEDIRAVLRADPDVAVGADGTVLEH